MLINKFGNYHASLKAEDYPERKLAQDKFTTKTTSSKLLESPQLWSEESYIDQYNNQL